MKILAIDTSTEACSAALLDGTKVTERYELAPRRHSQLILSMVDILLKEANITLAELDAIAFGQGPGSFTGVRIAASVAQGLAFAYDLLVVPVSTLSALALGAYLELNASFVFAAIDARMDEIYYGFYQIDAINKIMPMTKEILSKSSEIIAPKEASWIGVGTGAGGYPTAKCFSERYPRARDIVQLASMDYLEGKYVTAEFALPQYLRDSVAWQRQGV